MLEDPVHEALEGLGGVAEAEGHEEVPSKRVMSSPLEHKTIFFSEFRLGDLMLYVATKFN